MSLEDEINATGALTLEAQINQVSRVRPFEQLIPVFETRKRLRPYAEGEARAILGFMGLEDRPTLLEKEIQRRLDLIAPLTEAERAQERGWLPYDPTRYTGKVTAKLAGIGPELHDFGQDAYIYPILTGLAKGGTQIGRGFGYLGEITVGRLTSWAARELTGSDTRQWHIEEAFNTWRKFMDRIDTKYVGDSWYYLNQDLTRRPEDDPWYSYNNVANFIGSATTYLAGGMLVGAFGAAVGRALGATNVGLFASRTTGAFYAAVASGNTYAEVRDEALQRGYSRDEAESLGTTAAILLLPVSYYLNMKFDPVVRSVRDKPLPKTLFGNLLYAGATNAIQNAGERATVEAYRMVRLEDMYDAEKGFNWSAVGASLDRTLLEAGLGFAAGSMFGAFSAGKTWLEQRSQFRMGAAELIKHRYHKTMDVYSPKDLFNEALRLGATREQARALVGMWDALTVEYQRQNGLRSKEEAWTSVFANHSEREDLARQVLTLNMREVPKFFLKSRAIIGSEEFHRSFGNKPAQPQAVLSWLRSKGVGPTELEWTGLAPFLVTESAKGRKVTRDQLLDVLLEERVRVETVRKGEDIAREFSKQAQELETLARDVEKEINKRLDRVDKAKPEEAAKIKQELQELTDRLGQIYEVRNRAEQEHEDAETVYPAVRPGGPKGSYEEILIRLPAPTRSGGEETKFQSDHWSEPNVLVHMRFDVRPTADGDAWHLIELQSDWNQKGRDVGFGEEGRQQKLEAAEAAYKEAKALSDSYADQQQRKKAELPEAEYRKWLEEWKKAVDETVRTYQQYSKLKTSVPVEQNPFQSTSAWVDLSLKYMLMEAVQRGANQIIWSKGDMQNVFQGGGTPEMLAGRKEFYDNILPKALLKLARRLDPDAKLETTTIRVANRSVGSPLNTDEALRLAALLEPHRNIDERMNEIVTSLGERGYDHTMSIVREAIDILADRDINAANTVREFYNDLLSKKETVPLLRITEPMKAKIDAEGLPLFHKTKASVTFLDNGKAFMRFFQGADFESAIHEMGHILRRTFLRGKDLKTVEDALGVVNGQWDVESEERFTEWFMQSLMRMESPHPALKGVFDQLKGYLRASYRAAAGMEMPPKMNDTMQSVIARLLIEDNNAVKAATLKLEERKAELAKVESQLRSISQKKAAAKRPRPEGAESKRPETPQDVLDTEVQANALRVEAERLREEIKAARLELREAYRQRVTLDPSTGERRRLDLQDRIAHMRPMDYKDIRNGLAQTGRQMKALFRSFSRLGDTPTTRLGLELYNDAWNFRRLHRAAFDGDIKEFVAGASRKTKRWLRQHDERTWQSNFLRLLDETSRVEALKDIPEDIKQEVEAIRILATIIHDTNTKKMIEEGVHRRLHSGAWVPVRDSFMVQIPRMLTADGRDIFLRDPALLGQFIEKVKELNPGIDPKLIEREFSRARKEILNRRIGALEFSRRIKHMPDKLVSKDGKVFDIFHNDPYETITRMLDLAGMRIAETKYFGQAVLPNIYRKPGVIREVAKIFGRRVKLTKGELRDKLIEGGVNADEIKGASYKDLVAKAKLYEISPDVSVDVLYERVMALTPELLNRVKDKAAAEKQLRELAKKIRGIDHKASLEEVLWGIKRRLSEDIQDNVLAELKRRYALEGGNPELWDTIHADFQGVPRAKWAEFAATSTGRGLKLYSNAIGVLHTSLAPFKGIFQTFDTLPSVHGFWATMRAWARVLDDYDTSRERAIKLGAIQNIVRTWGADDSYLVSKASKILREGAGKFLLHDRVAELNNVVSAEVGYDLALQWRKKFTKADEPTARFLLLSDREIAGLYKGELPDQLLAKIVQNTVSQTQEGQSAPHLKGEIELNPLVKLLFSYQSFAARKTRAAASVYTNLRDASREFYRAMNAKDIKRMQETFPAFARSTSAALTLVASAIGVGLMIQWSQREIKKLVKVDEPIGETIKDALIESSVLGLWSAPWGGFDRARDGKDYILGFMPILTATASLFDVAFGWSRYGEFALGRRAMENFFTTTPAAQALRRQIDHMRYPEFEAYMRVKTTANRWMAEQRSTQAPATQLNPKYHAVWEKVARLDLEGAQQEAANYYRRQLAEGVPWDESIRGLRQSLNSRRPLYMSDENLMKFLSKLSPEERREFLRVNARYMQLMDLVAPPSPE